MLAAMLAMMMVAAAPAIAQSTTGDTEGTNGGGDQYAGGDQYDTTVSDNTVVTQTQAAELTQDCRTIVTVNNTGTATGGDQYSTEGDNNQTVQVNFGDTTVNVTGAQCEQVLNQVQAGEDAATAVATAVGGTPVASADVNEDTTAGQGADTEEATAAEGATATADDSDSLSVLPDTGGISFLTLGAGALLVAGGLLARRIVR